MSDLQEILLVEDNPYDAELTTRALKTKNLSSKLTHVRDGEEALEYLFEKGKYAERGLSSMPILILLDLKLPKVNGLELLKELKMNEKTKAIPTVVLTSSKEIPDIRECYKLGVNSYIVKPVDFDEYTYAVSEAGVYWININQQLK